MMLAHPPQAGAMRWRQSRLEIGKIRNLIALYSAAAVCPCVVPIAAKESSQRPSAPRIHHLSSLSLSNFRASLAHLFPPFFFLFVSLFFTFIFQFSVSFTFFAYTFFVHFLAVFLFLSPQLLLPLLTLHTLTLFLIYPLPTIQ